MVIFWNRNCSNVKRTRAVEDFCHVAQIIAMWWWLTRCLECPINQRPVIQITKRSGSVIKTHPRIFLRAPQNSLNDSVWQTWSLEEISGCQEMATPVRWWWWWWWYVQYTLAWLICQLDRHAVVRASKTLI